jgi:UDP-N-acetylmuramate: L-alanyl-gamma-D-glutamyl-meso-diaminopimelate ligase
MGSLPRKRIYFIGIGGVAMGNIAILAHRMGYDVRGSDRKLHFPMEELLRKNNIPHREIFSVEYLKNFVPELVIVGNVVARGNEEVEYVLRKCPCAMLSLPEFLSRHLIGNRRRIVIAGTHGKTTTSAMAAFYMQQLAIDCGYFIGGAPLNFDCGAHMGSENAPFILEGDEYDCAFFDKRSKFIHYMANTAVINGIDFDHGDIFFDLRDVQRAFRHFLRTIPSDGHVLVNGDDPNVAAILPAPWTKVLRVGWERGNDVKLQNFSQRNDGSIWEVTWNGKLFSVETALHGEFNALNGTMAILACHSTMGTQPIGHINLRSFRGVRRRQEKCHEDANSIIFEDFGHHPRAIAEVLRSLRSRFPQSELIACFEPATQTSMRNIFEDAFCESFSLCNRCFWGQPRCLENIPEGERLRVDRVMETLGKSITEARYFPRNQQLLQHLLEILNCPRTLPGQRVVVLFSNGSFPQVISHWKYHESSEITTP